MKILFVTRGFPSEQDPMSGNYEAVQAKAIAAKGHEVSVISVYEQSERYAFSSWKITHSVVDGVNVYEEVFPVIHIRFVRRLNKYLRKYFYRRAFERYVKEQGMPDIVHGHIISTSSHAIFYKEDYHTDRP